jgi:hypothetical protein
MEPARAALSVTTSGPAGSADAAGSGRVTGTSGMPNARKAGDTPSTSASADISQPAQVPLSRLGHGQE